MKRSPSSLIRNRALSGFHEMLSDLGHDADELLLTAGIAPTDLHGDEKVISLDKVALLLTNSAKQLKIKDFGLHFGSYQDISVLGSVAMIAKHSSTVGEAIEHIAKYIPYHTPGASLVIDISDDERVQLNYSLVISNPKHRRQVMELSYIVFHNYLKILINDDWGDWKVSFRHHSNLSQDDYKKFFGCKVMLNQPQYFIELPITALDQKIDQSNLLLKNIAKRNVNNIIKRFPLDLKKKIEELCLRQITTGRCTMTTIAQQLGMHERTMQRRLKKQNLYFEDIIDNLRKHRAKEYLSLTQLPLIQITSLLGYKEQSSLQRACKRWFKLTPQAYRDKTNQL